MSSPIDTISEPELEANMIVGICDEICDGIGSEMSRDSKLRQGPLPHAKMAQDKANVASPPMRRREMDSGDSQVERRYTDRRSAKPNSSSANKHAAGCREIMP